MFSYFMGGGGDYLLSAHAPQMEFFLTYLIEICSAQYSNGWHTCGGIGKSQTSVNIAQQEHLCVLSKKLS